MRKAARYLFIALVVTAVWVSWNRPDWIVAGLPKNASALAPSTAPADLIATANANKTTGVATTPSTPQMQISDNKPATDPAQPKTHTIPSSVGYGGTPLPAVEAVDGADYVRSDGFQNMCYQMADGSWTTVIYQGAGGPGMYPYKGDIDVSTGAPATAAGSQQWCAEHASV